MSESTSQEKTEQATPKKLRDAREEGQVARSRELTTAVLIAGGALVLGFQGGAMVENGVALLRDALSFDVRDVTDARDLAGRLGYFLRNGLLVAAPILALGFFGALFAPLLLGGWNLSGKAMAPKLSKLDPIKGLGRIFSGKALVDLGLGILKVLILGGIGVTVVWLQRSEIPMLARMDAAAATAELGFIVVGVLGWLSIGLAAIAALDVPWQIYKHAKELKMTKQQVKEEFKQTEGKPEVKARVRQLQQQMAQGRMMEAVPDADVVITNPTHYAVALKYSADSMRAPRVVAKGAGAVAAAIRELASRSKVPLVSAPPLARALFRSARIEQEIPAQLFQAVAQILTYVYQLRSWRTGMPYPDKPVPGDVPGGEPDPESER